MNYELCTRRAVIAAFTRVGGEECWGGRAYQSRPRRLPHTLSYVSEKHCVCAVMNILVVLLMLDIFPMIMTVQNHIRFIYFIVYELLLLSIM